MARPEPADRESRLVTTAGRLRVDAGTAEVLGELELAGVKALLLKDPSIARWLYTEGEPRGYVDCDLLIAPADGETAELVLESIGYRRSFDDRAMPSWWRERASAWVLNGDGPTVDLHCTPPGIGVDDEAAWRALSAQTDVVMVAEHLAATLALPGRALHVALHAGDPPARLEALRNAEGDRPVWFATDRA